jgi:D-beta-D-heptose 7-phosphate kinase/D-beta-D-heptose 1-phosphate adenosyltransferase
MIRTRPSVCVIGDALLDLDWEGPVERVCRDAPAPVLDTPAERARPGGAALAATFAAASGADTTLVTALSTDRNGRHLRHLLERAGIEVVDLGLDGPTPVKLRLRAGGQSIARVDRWCSPVVTPGRWSPHAAAAASRADTVLVSDYGRHLAATPAVASHGAFGGRPVVWDPHVDGPRPPASTTLATPDIAEAVRLTVHDGLLLSSLPDVVALACEASRTLGCATSVTAGPLGAVLADDPAMPTIVPTVPAQGDTCGAGDRYAASATVALARGAGLLDAVRGAVEDARAFVSGDGSLLSRPDPTVGPRRADGPVVALPAPARQASDPVAAAAAVRRSGGVLVATGGCFDVLHTGHIHLLEEARRLGDHLVVCLNSDQSVRRLKGPHRPLNPAEDRAAVLHSLACVDGVVVFDDDTPCAALQALQPHLFAKGADYQGTDIAERDVLGQWGGQVVLLPLVSGRSTTRLIATAAAAGA